MFSSIFLLNLLVILTNSHFPFDFFFPNSPFDLQPINAMIKQLQSQTDALKAHEATQKMSKGIGGITAIQTGTARNVLIKNGQMMECLGNIGSNAPTCDGELRDFKVQYKNDFCYSSNYVRINNDLCIGTPGSSGISFRQINSKFECKSTGEVKPLHVSLEEFRNICGKLPWEYTYKYYSDVNDPFHVPIPNKYNVCLNNEPNICIFQMGKQIINGGGVTRTFSQFNNF